MYNRIYNLVYFFALITAEGNDALDPHNAMDQEPPVIAVTETATTDSYETVLSKIKELSLIPISCQQHPGTLPHLIMEYVQIRFHFEATRYQNLHLSKLKASILNHKKLSTVVFLV